MIARMWRGWVHTAKAEQYAEIVERTGMAGYRAMPGSGRPAAHPRPRRRTH